MHDHRSTLARRGALAAALALLAAPATAQSLQVLELNYAPTTSAPLDLRPGPYLLELRGPSNGPYAGVLRGPNNETVATDLSVTATGCATGLPSSPRMTVTAQPGRLHVNAITIAISGTGTCQLSTTAANLSLVSSTGKPPPQYVTCNGDPANAEKASLPGNSAAGKPAGSGERIACSEVDPSVTLAPDLKPVPPFSLGGQVAPWGGVIQVTASQAASRSDGRCYYPYVYDIGNIGNAPSGGTISILTAGDPLGLNIQTRTVPALLPAGQVPINGLIGLPPGRWELNVYVDPNNAVLEFNGGNNVGTVRVEVNGRCTTP
jgi:hypothetical protein